MQIFRTGDMWGRSLPEGMEQEDVKAIGEYLHSLFPRLDVVRMRDLAEQNQPRTCRCLDSVYYLVLNEMETARETRRREGLRVP